MALKNPKWSQVGFLAVAFFCAMKSYSLVNMAAAVLSKYQIIWIISLISDKSNDGAMYAV